ncbi:hypothetical protein [Mesorhizobium sp. L2C067A000]|uniref:hypothetical protein n=1 Tax=Mesorhizobium sp. L2C067A000 TaxID=1287106 RepID=UPI0003D015C1|nr:hypothetical protein [Mesorhizobium sp. L2C067A000]ESZ29627.1 hypothetical protein X733_24995 [Mesorhizobium sp. L2C067A000]
MNFDEQAFNARFQELLREHAGACDIAVVEAINEQVRKEFGIWTEPTLDRCSSSQLTAVLIRELAKLNDAPARWRLFREHWSGCDDTYGHRFEFLSVLPRLVGMTHGNDQDFFDALPSEFRVYRGCASDRVHGLSWTTDKATAVRFARGRRRSYKSGRTVVSTMINKTDVMTVFHARNEYEVLLDFTALGPVKKVHFRY